jgi:two-component system, response regulator YesN
LIQLLQDLFKSVPDSWNFGVETDVFEIINSDDLEEASQVIIKYCDNLINTIVEKGNDPGSLIVEKVKSYIMANLNQDLTTQRIGDEVFMSRSHLSRLFYMKTGVMPKDFIIEARVNKACNLLKRYDLQIQEIGDLVGYSNNQSVTRVSKEKNRVSPGDFRRRLLAESDSFNGQTK